MNARTQDEFTGLKPTIGEQRMLADTKGMGIHVEVLAVYDHDYLGWHAYVQYWDERPPSEDRCWQYALVLSCSENDWSPRCVNDWGKKYPSHAEVGRRVDLYLTSPDDLRFMLR